MQFLILTVFFEIEMKNKCFIRNYVRQNFVELIETDSFANLLLLKN